MHFSIDRTAHTTAFDGPVVDHWLEWKIAQTANASAMQDRSAMQDDPNRYSWVLYRLSYVPLRLLDIRTKVSQNILGIAVNWKPSYPISRFHLPHLSLTSHLSSNPADYNWSFKFFYLSFSYYLHFSNVKTQYTDQLLTICMAEQL